MSEPEFVYTTYINATPERLWQGLTDPAIVRRCWRGLTFDPAAGHASWPTSRPSSQQARHPLGWRPGGGLNSRAVDGRGRDSQASLVDNAGLGGGVHRATDLALARSPSAADLRRSRCPQPTRGLLMLQLQHDTGHHALDVQQPATQPQVPRIR
jgi:hypothetical protein